MRSFSECKQPEKAASAVSHVEKDEIDPRTCREKVVGRNERNDREEGDNTGDPVAPRHYRFWQTKPAGAGRPKVGAGGVARGREPRRGAQPHLRRSGASDEETKCRSGAAREDTRDTHHKRRASGVLRRGNRGGGSVFVCCRLAADSAMNIFF